MPQFQREVIALFYEKWSKMDNYTASVQEDIDRYVNEYILPIQERQQELEKLETSAVSIPKKQGIVGKIGKFFERFFPVITKEGRQKRDIEDKKQTIESEIRTFKIMIEKNPFEILGTNKDVNGMLLEKIDVTQLDKYSTMKNEPNNYLKPNRNVKSIADSIKREDITNLLARYPNLQGHSTYLISDIINNGLEAFNARALEIVMDSSQTKSELIPKIDFGIQKGRNKDLLEIITQQIEDLLRELTPEELDEFTKKEKQGKSIEEKSKE